MMPMALPNKSVTLNFESADAPLVLFIDEGKWAHGWKVRVEQFEMFE